MADDVVSERRLVCLPSIREYILLANIFAGQIAILSNRCITGLQWICVWVLEYAQMFETFFEIDSIYRKYAVLRIRVQQVSYVH